MSKARTLTGTVEMMEVLHVDDEPGFADLTATFLEREDDQFTVETVTTVDKALERIDDRRPDCIVSDYNMPGMNGLEFLQAVRERYPDLPFILFTGKGSETIASDAISAGVTDYLQKGSGTERYELLANRIRNAVRARREAHRVDRQEQLARLTEFAGDTGGFELDVDSGELLLTDGTRHLAGLPDDTHLTLEEAIELYHPDDRVDIRQTVTRAAEAGEQTRGTWRLQPLDGDERLVEVTVKPATESGDVTTLRGALHDVTERRKRRQDLEQIETLFQNAQDSLFLIDVAEEFTVERVNPAYEAATGLSAGQLAGRTPRKIFGEQQGAAVERRYRDCVEEREPLEYTERLRFDGGPRQWESRIAPVVLDDSVEYIVGATRDVTDREERERELNRLQQAIDGANVPITLADPSREDNPLVYVNDAFEEVTGYPPGDALGRNCGFLQGEDTDPEKASALRRAIDNGEPASVELRNYRRDGTEFWNRLTVTPIYDDDGDLVRYLGTQEDITERERRRTELQEYETIIESLSDAVYVLDEDGRFTYVNDELVELVGYNRETILGNTPSLIKDEDAVERAERELGRLLSSDGPEMVTFEVTLQPRDCDPITCEDHIGVLPYEGDEFDGSVGTLRDITERKKRRRKLERQNARLQEFVSVVSHDLRNPLNVALGHTELAQRECDSEHLDTVGDAVDRCEVLVEDLLALARSGKAIGTTEPVTLSELAEECWQTTSSEDATLAVETNQTITADRSRLLQLFENLFRNAVNHGGGEVTVTVGEIADGFYVADNGEGISAEDCDDIFEAGYSTADDGTGFGLAIVREIVEAHGWEIRVADSQTGGVRFEIIGVETAR